MTLIFLFYLIYILVSITLLFFFFKLKLFFNLIDLLRSIRIRIHYIFVISTIPATIIVSGSIWSFRIISFRYQKEIKNLLDNFNVLIDDYKDFILLFIEIIFVNFFIFLINFFLIFLFLKKK